MLDPVFAAFGRHSTALQMEALLGAVGKATATEASVESVHQVRVMGRRLRSRLRLFSGVWPRRLESRCDREVRRLTKAFGPVRDSDVQRDAASNYGRDYEDCPELQRLVKALGERKNQQRAQAIAAAAAFQDGAVSKALAREASKHPYIGVLTPYLFTRVYQSVMGQVQAIWTACPNGALPADRSELHSLRIAIKQLRYSVEALVPAYPHFDWEGTLEVLKQMQTLLGEVHDADLWLEALADCRCKASEGGCFRDFQKARRRDCFEESQKLWRLAEATGFWDSLGTTVSEPAQQAALDGITEASGVEYLQRMGSPDREHVEQVSRLSLLLFDRLQSHHGLGTAERALLQKAAALHDIGWLLGQRSHHKTGLRMIMASSALPWDAHERLLVGSIVRYHRRAEPKASHSHWRALCSRDQRTVAVCAGLLRAADALDRSHTRAVADVFPSAGDSLVLSVTGTDTVLEEFPGCEAKGALLASALGFRDLRCERG